MFADFIVKRPNYGKRWLALPYKVRHMFGLAKLRCRTSIDSDYTNGFIIFNCLGAEYDLGC